MDTHNAKLSPRIVNLISCTFLTLAALMFVGCGTTSKPGSSSATAPVAPSSAQAGPVITTQPISQTVTVGQPATFTVATTGAATMLYQWSKNGIAIVGATSSTYTVPATTASESGSQISVVVTNGMGSVTSISVTLTATAVSGTPVSGTPAPAISTLVLNASAASLNFGSVTVSSSSMQSVTLANAGTSNVTISNVSIAGAGFTASGVPAGTILTPGQTGTMNVTFSPAASGAATGSITVTSNASSGPNVIALSGTSTVLATHTVTLSWVASTSTVVGYNVYVSTVSGTSYAKLTSTPVVAEGYTDSGLQTPQTRYYVVTSVGSNNNESAYSNQASAIIP